METDSDVDLAVRPAPHPWLVLREHAHLVPAISLGGAHLSHLTLPVVPTPKLGKELPCGAQEAVRCIPPS